MQLHPYAKALEARDLDGMLSLLAEDVIVHSPWVSGPGFEGRESVATIFAIVFDALKDDDYTHDVGNERFHVLVANYRVLDNPLTMTTLLEFDAERKIREVWMMARPLVGLTALAEAIGQAIEGQDPQVHELAKPLSGLAVAIDRVAARLIGDLNRSTT